MFMEIDLHSRANTISYVGRLQQLAHEKEDNSLDASTHSHSMNESPKVSPVIRKVLNLKESQPVKRKLNDDEEAKQLMNEPVTKRLRLLKRGSVSLHRGKR